MDGIKSPLQSLTINAAAGSAIASAVGLIGVAVDPTLVTQAVNAVLQILAIGASLLAIVGRMRATTRISNDA